MKKATLVGTLLFLASGASPALAQECRLLCEPSFVAQPGIVIFNARGDEELGGRSTEATFQLSTLIPTKFSRVTLLGLLGWTPFAKTEGYTSNAPYFSYGPLFTLFKTGPLDMTFDLLGVYLPSGETSDYQHQFALEVDVGFALGSLLPSSSPTYLQNVGLYAFFYQQMTNVPLKVDGSKYYSPDVYIGVTLPLAPLP
jgi:hypothetical protein